MAPTTRSLTQTSLPITRVPETSKLLSLSPELLDHILSFLAPRTSLATRRILIKLLRVSPLLNPLIRRRLYKSVSTIFGNNNNSTSRDSRLLALLTSGVAAPYVRNYRFKLPEPHNVSDKDFDTFGPVAGVVSNEKWVQARVLPLVTKALGSVKGLLKLELEARIGTKEEGREEGKDEQSGREALIESLHGLTRLEHFGMSIKTRNQVCQILATDDFISPWIPALASWQNLTTLDFWRVHLNLSSLPTVAQPTFKLRTLALDQCEFNSVSDLYFLLGTPDAPRTSRLVDLTIAQVDFLSTPGISDPIFQLFHPPPSTPPLGLDEPFAPYLTRFELEMPQPFSPALESSLPKFFNPLTTLTTLYVGGKAVTPSLLASLPVVRRLTTLELKYVPNLPSAAFLDLVSHPSTLSSLSYLALRHKPSLPRHLTHDQMSGMEEVQHQWPSKELAEVLKWGRRRERDRFDGFELQAYGKVVDWDEEFSESEGEGDTSDAEEEEDFEFNPQTDEVEENDFAAWIHNHSENEESDY